MTSEETGPKRKVGDVIGDYRLTELVSRGAGTGTWKAQQISIQRPVVLEMLKQDWAKDTAVREAFLADVKAKAAINHPVIGHVYEAQSGEEGTFLAREVLEGVNLEEHIESKSSFKPKQIATQIENIAAAFYHLEQQNIATVGLAPHHVVLNDQGDPVRLVNLAVHGPVDPKQHVEDKRLLGELYDDLLKRNLPGSVRCASLLDYMADTSRPEALTWDQINRLAKGVREELTDTESLQEVVAKEKKAARSNKITANIWALLGGLGLILALLYFFVIRSGEQREEPVVEDLPVELPPVELSSGEGEFRISAHEVTISQYARFLDALSKLSEEQKKLYDHKDQPETKTDHRPNDWQLMLAAAKSRTSWSGRAMNENCPVVGVDFWDAAAYANWSEMRLPTAQEWLSAASIGTPPNGVSNWGDATVSPDDRTGQGLIGMAGNVAEWTTSIERNPAFPLDPKQPVICGGSFQAPAAGFKTRSFLKTRDIRRDDLGFRTMKSSDSE